jgi:hypothetical protein
MANMLPRDQDQLLKNNNSNKSLDIRLRPGDTRSNIPCEVIVPQIISEGRSFRREMRSTINDNDFQLKGQLKESIGEIIEKFPTIKSGSKGMELTHA